MIIRIKGHTFKLSEPHQEGDRLSAGEAQALNALRAENIRNNMAKKLAKLQSPLTPAGLEVFTSEVVAYDQAYIFQARPGSPKAAGSFDAEVQKLAREVAEAKVRADQLPPGAQGWLEHELATSPEIHNEARRRLALRDEVARKALEEDFLL